MRAVPLGRWLRSTLRSAARVGLALAVLAVASALGVRWWLASSDGARALRDLVVETLDEALEGRVELDGLSTEGERVSLRGVRVLTPEGELVLECPELEAELDLRALAAKKVTLRSLTLRAPRLHLLTDERGSNLVRALAPRASAAPATSHGDRARFELRTLQVERLEVLDATVDHSGGAQRFGAAKLRVAGDARVTLEPFAFEGRLDARAPTCEPGAGACSVVVAAAPDADGGVRVEVDARFGESQAKGTLQWPKLEARALDVRVAPAEARALVADWPVRVPLRLRGDLSRGGGRLVLDDGATASLRLEGRWDLPSRSVNQLRVDARLDGASAQVQGSGEAGAIALDGALRIEDARGLRAAVAQLVDVRLPDAALQGTLGLRVRGPLATPALALDGRLKGLRVGAVSAEGADLEVHVPDVTKPLQTDGRIEVRRLVAGSVQLERLGLELETSGRRVRVAAVASALAAMRLELAGVVDEAHQRLRLDALRLEDGERTWLLEHPTSVSFEAGRVAVGPARVESQGQRLVWGGGWADERTVSGHLALEGLRLEALPPLLRAYTAAARGRVDAELSAEGPWPRVGLRGRVQLREASLGRLRVDDARLSAEGSPRDGARGQLVAASSVGTIAAAFAVPALWTPAARHGALTVSAEGEGLELASALALAGVDRPIEGRVRWRATASGSLRAPQLDLDARAERLAYVVPGRGAGRALEVRDLSVHAALAPGRPLGASVSGSLLGGTVEGSIDTALGVERLEQGPLATAEARSLLRAVRLKASGVRLEELEGAARLLSGAEAVAEEGAAGAPSGERRGAPLAGAVELELSATGTPEAPVLAARATLRDVAAGSFRRLHGQVDLAADDDGVRGRVTTTEGGAPLVDLDVTLPVPPATLARPEGLATAPLRLQATLHATPVARLKPAGVGDGLRGTASGTLLAGGTLDEVRVDLDAGVDGLGLDELSLGRAQVRVVSDGGLQHAVAIDLQRDGKALLSVRGAVEQHLGLALLRGGTPPSSVVADAGLALSVEANELDLSPLSGFTESVRTLGGAVSLRGAVTGTLARPRLTGAARWRGGRAVVRGLGDVRDLEVDLTSDGDAVELTRLVGRSAGGSVDLRGRAQRLQGGAFRVEVAGTTRRWPVLREDQLMAFVSGKVAGAASVSSGLVDFTALDISRAEVELPELLHRDLQALERPSDVVVVRRSAPRGAQGRPAAEDSPAAATEPSPERAREDDAPWRFRARCTAPRNLWVKSSDVKLELGLSEGFLVEYAGGLSLSGRVSVHRGRLNVIGREFEVVEGAHARFAGPASRPSVAAQAQYQHEQDGERIRVTVAVNGRGSDLAFKVSSEPPMPESEIYTLLATGRRALRRGGGASVTPEQAVSALGSVAATALKTALSKELPVDVLNLQAADGFSGVGDLKVDVGKYLSDALFLGFSVQPGARPERGESHYKGKLELQLSRNVSAQAWAGTAPAMGAGVVWSREY